MSETNKSPISMTVSLPEKPVYRPTIQTFVDLISQGLSGNIRLNTLIGVPEICKCGEWVWFKDSDEAEIRNWLQQDFGISHKSNFDYAFSIFLSQNEINPLQQMLTSLQWDGQSRMEHFLPTIMKCENTPAIREISKLIFIGGVRRAYEPGCKFDYMPVLIGEQGCGKSTIVEWLAMGYFGKINTFHGKTAIEHLFGVWIGEVDEMSAMYKAKSREEVKAFISTAADAYRTPYEKYSKRPARTCILIGTTNNKTFLNDLTGNRRFFPIEVHSSASYLYSHEQEVKEYIQQCWAEAVSLYKQGQLPKDYDHSFDAEFEQMRASASVDDADIGMIEAYLARKHVGDYVCGLQLWIEACEHDREKYKPHEGRKMGEIMDSMSDWELCEKRPYINPVYGTQKAWRKTGPSE